MKIIQLVPNLSYGDAVGNDTIALKSVIRERGYETQIYAEGIADNGIEAGTALLMPQICKLEKDDIVILHVATSSDLNKWIKAADCRKVMVYHNITPPHFFSAYNSDAEASCRKGLEEVRSLSGTFGMVLAVSDFNRKDLRTMGYECPINVLPVVIPFGDYKKPVSRRVMQKYGDGLTNILFVGRIAPNKCQQDVIRAFADYQRHFNPCSRLFLVGNPGGFENYERRLKSYAEALGVRNVVFTGHIRFAEILACYRLADLFLCQSEHEGFCVPLAEAMAFDIPIVAYDSGAIGETLGGGGFLLKEKNPLETAAVMHRILSDKGLRQAIVARQHERLAAFQYEREKALFWKYMDEFIGGTR